MIAGLGAQMTSCALGSRFRFEQPTIELQAVQITGIGLSGGSLILSLDAYNPNGYDLQTTRLSAALRLEDTHFGDATLDEFVVLGSKSHTIVDVPVRFTWEGVGVGARALLQTGTVNYTLDSQIGVDTPVGERTLDLRNAGVVPLRQLLP
jgi:LEA14-like dessication related protein